MHVAFTWPALVGPPDARSAHGSLGLEGHPIGMYAVRGEATNLTVNVTTEHPGLWTDAFRAQLRDAGLSEDRGFELARGLDWIQLDVWGLLDPGPTSDRFDVSVDLRSVETDVRLGS